MSEAKWRRYLRFWRPSIDTDLDDELRFHFDERIEALLANGLTRDEARQVAEREFGDVTVVRQRLREIDRRVEAARARSNRLEAWWQDLIYSARGIRRAPGLALTIVFTLALGVGINATLFSLLDRVFLRMPTGVSRPEALRRLYWVGKSINNNSVALPYFSIPVADAVTDALRGLATTTVYRHDTKHFGTDKESGTLVVFAGAGYFAVLGVHPAFGRFFSADEERIDVATPVAVVSEEFWQRRFGGSPADAIGQTIVLDKQRFTVIGVAPRGFTGVDLDAADLWIPLGATAAWGSPWGGPTPWYKASQLYGFYLLARPTGAPAPAQLEAVATVGARRGFTQSQLQEAARVLSGPIIAARGPEPRQQELAISIRLGGVALIVLLIACANVANLLLAHAMRRRREIAVRAALGITPAGIVRLVLAESVLLALGAGFAAFVVASWSSVLLRRLLFPDIHWSDGVLDWRVGVFTLVVALLAGIVSGLLPAYRATRTDVSHTLKSGVREGTRHRSRLRVMLVLAQAALSTVLLVGAVLFVKSLHAIRGLDLGYDVQRLVFVSVDLGGTSQPRMPAPRSAELPILASRLAQLPGVEKVALTSMLPMYGMDFSTLLYSNGDTLPSWTDGAPSVTAVSPDFFPTTGLRLLRGRPLTQGDVAAGNVAVINQTLARSAWPHDDALGRCLRLGKGGPCVRIVGIVEDARRVQLIEPPARQLYMTMRPAGVYSANNILLRVAPDHQAAVAVATTREVTALFPGAESHIQPMADVLAPQYRPWQLGAKLFTVFGLLALLVAAVGVFSTLSHEVGQRRHELGVRVALGADAHDVMRLVLGDGLRVVIGGAAIGSVLALAGGRLVASLLYGVAPHDPGALVMVAGLLIAVAALASALPAWRASRADPLESLRAE